jgi:hypothetical protein
VSETYSPSGTVSATTVSRFTAAEAATGTFGTMDRATITELLDRTRYLDQTGQLQSALKAFIGDSANADITLGLTINQGAADDQILALKSSDVAHSFTSVTEADTFGYVKKNSATAGGLLIAGVSEGNSPIQISGLANAGDTTKSTAAVGAVQITGVKLSGNTTTALGANENILVVTQGTDTKFILDADGDSHQDVGTAWTNF